MWNNSSLQINIPSTEIISLGVKNALLHYVIKLQKSTKIRDIKEDEEDKEYAKYLHYIIFVRSVISISFL